MTDIVPFLRNQPTAAWLVPNLDHSVAGSVFSSCNLSIVFLFLGIYAICKTTFAETLLEREESACHIDLGIDCTKRVPRRLQSRCNMTAFDIDAFEVRAAEAERRLALLEQKGGQASSGMFPFKRITLVRLDVHSFTIYK